MSNRKFWIGLAALAAMLAYSGAGQAGEQYTARSLKGVYGFSGSGTLLAGSAAVVGLTRFDGMEGCHTTAVLNVISPSLTGVIPLSSTTCSYTVNSDGTGTQMLILEGPAVGTIGPFTSDFVIVDGKNEVHFMLSDGFGGGTVASGVSKRQMTNED
jgi:hypothetical protein